LFAQLGADLTRMLADSRLASEFIESQSHANRERSAET